MYSTKRSIERLWKEENDARVRALNRLDHDQRLADSLKRGLNIRKHYLKLNFNSSFVSFMYLSR